LTNKQTCVIIKVQKGKEMINMRFYEIKNTKTQQTAETAARTFAIACKQVGWKPQDCRCVWAAKVSNGY
jgi:hypothetical protein